MERPLSGHSCGHSPGLQVYFLLPGSLLFPSLETCRSGSIFLGQTKGKRGKDKTRSFFLLGARFSYVSLLACQAKARSTVPPCAMTENKTTT